MTKVSEPQSYDIELLCQILKARGKMMSRLGLSVMADKDRKWVDARGPLLEIHPNIEVTYYDNIAYYKWVT